MSTPEVGQKLHARCALDDVMYPAEVVAVSKAKKFAKTPVQVSFRGWDGEDVWCALGDLKCKALGLHGKAEKDGPKEKEVSSSKGSKKKEKDEGRGPEHRELPDIGDKVQAKSGDGKHYPGKVVSAKLQVKFADGTTKWVTVDDLKFKPKPPPAMFACTQCGQEFTTEIGRDNHWWDAHIVTCSECGKVFDNELKRDEHWWNEHIVSCKQCGKICENLAGLVTHTRETHAVHCKQCGKICGSIRSLVDHARSAHQYTQNLIDVSKEKKDDAGGKKKDDSAGKQKDDSGGKKKEQSAKAAPKGGKKKK